MHTLWFSGFIALSGVKSQIIRSIGNNVIIFDNLAPSHHKQINYEKNYTAIPIIYF